METDLGRVLVTGATGIVGFNLVRALAPDHDVRVLVRDPERARDLLPADVDLATGDLTDPASLRRAVDGCATVFHAAGMPEQWLRDPALFHRVNADGTGALVEAALAVGVSTFVHTSTIDVFDRRPGVPFDESRLATEPLGTAYQRSKQAADRLVTAALDRGLPARFTHPSAVYGPSPSRTPGMNDLLADLAANRTPALPPGGMPVVHAEDLARSHLLVASAPVGSRYILSDRYLTLREIAEIVRRLRPAARRPATMPAPIARTVSRATEALSRITRRPPLLPAGQLHFLTGHVLPDAGRARAELGWTTRSAEDGIAETLDLANAKG